MSFSVNKDLRAAANIWTAQVTLLHIYLFLNKGAEQNIY